MSGYIVQRSASGHQDEEKSRGSFHWREETQVEPWKMCRIWLGGRGHFKQLEHWSDNNNNGVWTDSEETSLYRVISKYDLW